MKSTIDTKKRLTLLSQMGEESKFQILKYNNLKGVENYNSTLVIKEIEDLGKRLKQVRIELNDSAIKIQNNSLSYIKGQIERKNGTNNCKGIKKIFFDRKSNEDLNIKTVFKGSGEILLEPSFQDFTLIELIDEEIIIDDDIFYACDNEIKISFYKDETKLKLSGSGILVLKLPVPECEIIRCKMFNDEIIVNNDIIILRSKNVKIEVEKIIEGEVEKEMLKKYKGTGEVWILPTRTTYRRYDKMDYDYTDETNKENKEEYKYI